MKLERWKLSAKSEHKLEKSLGPDNHDMELFYSFDLFTTRHVFHGDKRKLSCVCVSAFSLGLSSEAMGVEKE